MDQNVDAQTKALSAAGCGMVRTEQRSSVILDFIYPGGTLVVTRIDQRARSLSDL